MGQGLLTSCIGTVLCEWVLLLLSVCVNDHTAARRRTVAGVEQSLAQLDLLSMQLGRNIRDDSYMQASAVPLNFAPCPSP